MLYVTSIVAKYSHPRKHITHHTTGQTQILMKNPNTRTGERKVSPHYWQFLVHLCMFISSVANTWWIWALEEVVFHITNTIHLPAGIHTPVEAVPAEVDVICSRKCLKIIELKMRIGFVHLTLMMICNWQVCLPLYWNTSWASVGMPPKTTSVYRGYPLSIFWAFTSSLFWSDTKWYRRI